MTLSFRGDKEVDIFCSLFFFVCKVYQLSMIECYLTLSKSAFQEENPPKVKFINITTRFYKGNNLLKILFIKHVFFSIFLKSNFFFMTSPENDPQADSQPTQISQSQSCSWL